MSIKHVSREIGIISDTHGLLRPEAVSALAGVERIIHAGDVGRSQVLDELRVVAPLTVVRGNVDRGTWAEALPETAEIEIGGIWIHVLHILDDLQIDPAGGGFSVLIHGHSHQPHITRRGEVLYVNPGSAGPRRFKLPATVARLRIDESGPSARIVELP